jgi:hypothetical protein
MCGFTYNFGRAAHELTEARILSAKLSHACEIEAVIVI